jgi:hypothetical protein
MHRGQCCLHLCVATAGRACRGCVCCCSQELGDVNAAVACVLPRLQGTGSTAKHADVLFKYLYKVTGCSHRRGANDSPQQAELVLLCSVHLDRAA